MSYWDGSADLTSIDRAREHVRAMPFAELCVDSMRAAEAVGPWAADSTETSRLFWGERAARRILAVDIVDRFSSELFEPLEASRQEFRLPREGRSQFTGRLFSEYEDVYGDGQFTWAGPAAPAE